jgi:hypothetical protein
VKFSPDGTVGVQREWGIVGKTGIPNDDQTFAFGIAAAPDGGAFEVGDTSGTGFNPNLVAARFDSGGNFVWVRVGGPGFGSAQDVAVDADGSLHITGNVLTEPSGADAFVWNVLANGKGQAAAVWGGGDPFEGERGASIAIGPGGAIAVAGSAGASPYAFRSWIEEREVGRRVPRRVCGHRHGTGWSRGSIGGRRGDSGGQRNLRRLVGRVSPSHSALRVGVAGIAPAEDRAHEDRPGPTRRV